MAFDPVDPRQSFPEMERGILQYWKEEDVFRRSMEQRKDAERFSFYDGPPFATGLPHYGHLLAGTIKDVIPRYQTMKGKYVQRRFGWDCHGLPVENLVEKEQGIKGKQEIEEMGVAAFNKLCRESVQRYTKEWRQTVERTGRFVDMDWDYRTMDPDYMESMFWAFSQLAEKGLLYEGHKPMYLCPRCVTPLANFEVTQGYKDITDQSAVVKFELVDEPDTFILAWTTTPWTLPGNLFLAIGPKIEYVAVESDGKRFILAQERVEAIFGKRDYAVGKTVSHKSLLGKKYKPLFPYFVERYKKEDVFKIVAGDFVETAEGTGIVHIAPGFGEDDFYVGKKEGVPVLQHVTIEGKFTDDVTDFAGMDVKPIDDPTKTDQKIIAWLEQHGLLFERIPYKHSYPHCWRCDTPLLNYATSSWFVAVEKIKEWMLEANAQTEWVPAHLRDGRFGKWLEGARDWAISRNRYWGTPLPLWRADKDDKNPVIITGRDDLLLREKIRFTKLTMVRHGQSEGNVRHIYQGKVPGTPLTRLGQEQATKTGKRLAADAVPVNVIYCSPLQRAQETAAAIAKQTGAQVIVDERLREIDFGEYEGTTVHYTDLDFITARRAHLIGQNEDISVYHLPGMESWEQVQKRMSEFFHDILPRHRSEHVVVVSHGDPILNAKHFFTREEPSKLRNQPYPDYAGPHTFYWDHDRGAQMDLHKEVLDGLLFPGAAIKGPAWTIVRHGQTDLNVQGAFASGSNDVPLNDTGRTQAEETAKALSKEHFDVIVSSPLIRAKETADTIAKALGMEVAETLSGLSERHGGDWGGKKKEEIFGRHPPVREDAFISLHHSTPDRGESLSMFIARVRTTYEYLLKKYRGKKLLIVCHGGTTRALRVVTENRTYLDAATMVVENAKPETLQPVELLRRIPDVLDCWFESGSMPYAQEHFPFEDDKKSPAGFPADFIAEGIDQTRGWFYTLTVLSAALFQKPAFRHCITNGTVLAEDGRKMSKRLQNYPDPNVVLEKHGADAMRFALMSSQAVRGEDMRFSEKLVEDTVRSVILPLWNSYGFFVTYANAAGFKPENERRHSPHPLDRWIRAEVQDLANRMSKELDGYDLSATCAELHDTIDALTNWYIRLSRRRFAGKIDTEEMDDYAVNEEQQHDALATMYDVLLTVSQLLAPFCPFITDEIYLNLVPAAHGSVHLTDWPAVRKLDKEEEKLLEKTRVLRTIVSLGLKVRSQKTVKVRQPLSKATVALPPSVQKRVTLTDEDNLLLRQELNVKMLEFVSDPGSLGERIAQVDARKVGPRLGGRVQEVIAAGKRGEFEVNDDGTVLILDETLTPEEVSVLYRGKEGTDVAAEQGIVVSIETAISDELKAEGQMRELIRAVQKLRKDSGFSFTDRIVLELIDLPTSLKAFVPALLSETRAEEGKAGGTKTDIDLDGIKASFSIRKI